MRIYTILKKIAQRVFDIKDYVVESYVYEGASATWRVQKWQSGKMKIESVGLITKYLNFTGALGGSLYAATYTLTMTNSMVSTTPFTVSCNTMENNGATFWMTTTAQNNMTAIELLFARGSQGTNIRTQHSIVLIGTWK